METKVLGGDAVFYYYGAKNLMAPRYPAPRHKVIVEPFAGSAAYSCYHLLRDTSLRCILVESEKRVCDAWEKVLGMSVQEIQSYPTPAINEITSDFLLMTCATSNAVSRCKSLKFTDRLSKVFESQRRRLVKFHPINSRVRVVHDDFLNSPDIEATWFVDPPYSPSADANPNTIFSNGVGYKSRSINYSGLGDWCRSRLGQVIVCEKEGAIWLPFKKLHTTKTSLNRPSREVSWVSSCEDIENI